MRDAVGSKQGDISSGGGKWWASGCILLVEPIGFPMNLDMGGRERGVKNESNIWA